MRTITPFDELGRGDVAVAGGKGANLGELTRAGLPVPPGFVLTTAAYRAFLAETGIGEQVLALAALAPDAGPEAYESASARIRDLFRSAEVPDALARQVRDAAAQLGDAPLAVRSSATAEDLEDASFAGQQDTYLDVRGADRLLAAVRDCWASLWTARAMAYRARRGIDPAQVALAVVVQRMVDADAAGVMFTANPTNGRRDETVISAAWGLGESVVSGSVTTDDVVVEMPAGRVLSRTTADKAVMVVPTGHGAEERPVPQERRSGRVLDDAAAVELARLGARVAAHFGAPQDVEWARTGPDGEFWLVQARPVTALPDPEAPAPTDWSVPDPKSAYYMRASIVEQLPDPLSPLFADLVDGSVTRSLQALFREFVGRDVVEADDIGLPTVNGYAYYRYSRAGLGRIMLRSPAALRTVSTPGARGAQARWRDHAHPRYAQAVESWTGRPLGELTVPQLLDGVVALLDAATEYYTSVQTIIPIAVTSEVLFTSYYDRLVRRAGDPPASTFLLGFDSLPIRAEKSLHEIGTWAAAHDDLAAVLRTAPSTAAEGGDGRVDPATWQEWRTRFGAHLERYGHTVYNLDFLHAVPADDPAPLLETLRFYLEGGGADPNERQRRAAERREEATAAVLARLDPVRRAGFVRLLRWAQSAAPVREDALADVGLAWPQLRRMLREIGSRLAAAGRIERADDVFWLRRDEVPFPEEGSLRDEVEERKALWRGRRRATPPQILPVGTWWEAFEGMFPAASADQTGDVIRGIGASAGQVTAPARVLGGPADFGRMRPGDVLVAGITTPAWTPLFPMASAVVTDVGGPLSHSSIVAREYGIPAVLGTAVATRRITDGARIHVDGDAGTVTLIGDGTWTTGAAGPPEPAPALGRSSAVALGAAAVTGAALAAVWWRSRRRGRGE
jgi:phosphohistidine swiveling domain-containing protein